MNQECHSQLLHGCHSDRSSRIVAQEGERIISAYLAGASLRGLSRQYAVTRSVIAYELQRRQIPIDGNRRRLTVLRPNAFSSLNEESAYWIGFLMTDGCICDKGSGNWTVMVDLKASDAAHLDKLKQFVGAVGAVRPSRSRSTCALSFGCQRIIADLARYGVTPRKSLTASASEDVITSRDFWRGVIDGNGTICLTRRKRRGDYRPVLGLVGSHGLVSQFAQYIRHVVPAARALPHPQGRIYAVYLHNSLAVEAASHLYCGARVFLDRKYELAIRIAHHFKSTGRSWFADCEIDTEVPPAAAA